MKATVQEIVLQDQRKLSYQHFGNEGGYPIIYCHGSQSSRLEMHYDLSFTHKHDLNVITIDRPGHGNSDFNSKGSIKSFAHDVSQLLDHLKIDRCSVLGMSAGSPFAFGIANYFPEKINKVGIISGFAPYSKQSSSFLSKEVKLLLKLAKSVPFLLRVMLRIQSSQLKRNPQKSLKQFLQIMGEPDQAILKNPKVMEVIENMFTEAFKNGHQGVAHEISKILVQDWSFDLKEIKTPVEIWQGEKDNNVPKDWAVLMNERLPNSTLTLFPEEGHLIIFEHAEQIFSRMKI